MCACSLGLSVCRFVRQSEHLKAQVSATGAGQAVQWGADVSRSPFCFPEYLSDKPDTSKFYLAHMECFAFVRQILRYSFSHAVRCITPRPL